MLCLRRQGPYTTKGGGRWRNPGWRSTIPACRPRSTIPNVPLHQFLLDAAAKYPNKTALVFGNVVEPLGNALMDTSMTYGQLLELTQRFAAALQELGVQKGDRVAVHLPNCPQFVIAYYATLMVGGIVVPCNPQYVPRELRASIQRLGRQSGRHPEPDLSLSSSRSGARPNWSTSSSPTSKSTFPACSSSCSRSPRRKRRATSRTSLGDANTYWFQDLLAQAPAKPKPVEVTPEDTGVLMYTGGTTGVSKGAQLTHRNLVANALQVRWWMWDSKEGQEVMMTGAAPLPQLRMTVCMNHTIYMGGKMILIPNPRVLDHVLKSINKHKPTLFPGVPAMYVSVTNHPEIGKYDVSSIRACISGAAGLPPEVQDRFEKLTGGKLVEGYGLSEATPVTHCNPIYGKRKDGSWIGLPLPDTDWPSSWTRKTGETGPGCR